MFLDVLLIMASLVALLLPGFFLRKAKVLSDGAVEVLVTVLIYVCMPMLTLNSFLGQSVAPTLYTAVLMGLSFLFSLFGHLFIFFIAKLIFFKWKNKENASAYMFATTFSNGGYLGIPFVSMLFSDSQALLFAVMTNMAFNMLIWTLGIYILTGDKSAISLKKAFINPSVLPLFIALPLYFIPSINIISGTPIANAIKLLADMSAPLSMIIVGIRLADMGVLEAFKGAGNYLTCLTRLIVAPCALLAVAIALRQIPYISQIGTLFMAVPLVQLSMPAAATLVAFAEKTNRAKAEATRVFLTTTILSILSIPLIVLIIKAAGLI